MVERLKNTPVFQHSQTKVTKLKVNVSVIKLNCHIE